MFKNKMGKLGYGWIILISFLAMYIGQVILSIPGSILLAISEISNFSGEINFDLASAIDNNPWAFLLTQGGASVGGIIVTYLLWKYWIKKSLKELGFQGPIRDLLFGLFLGAASITIIFVILLATGQIELTNSLLNPKFSTFTIVFLILFILVGIVEEMFFRGYVMRVMEARQIKKWATYLVSAVIFSVAHGTNPNVSLIGLANILFVGLLFAYMFDKTKSLWFPIGYHITWNYFQGNVFGFAVSGIKPYGIYEVISTSENTWLTGGAFGLEGGLLATLLILLGFLVTYLYTKRTAN